MFKIKYLVLINLFLTNCADPLKETLPEPTSTLAIKGINIEPFQVNKTEVTVCNEVCLSGWTACKTGKQVKFNEKIYTCLSDIPFCFDGHEFLCLDIWQKKEYQYTAKEFQSIKHKFKWFAVEQIVKMIENEEFTSEMVPNYYSKEPRKSLEYMKDFLRINKN